MFKVVAFVFLYSCLGIAQTQSRPLPEPTRVFTCVQEQGFYPTDIVFAPDGTLYSTDAPLPLRDRNYSVNKVWVDPNLPYRWTLYEHSERDCTALRSSDYATSGLAYIEEDLCFMQASRLACLSGREIDLGLFTSRLDSYHLSGQPAPRDLVATKNGFWLLSDFLTPATGFNGAAFKFTGTVSSYFTNAVSDHVGVGNSAHFGTANKDALYATSYARNEVGIRGGWLTIKLNDVETRVQLDFDMPSGILMLNEHLCIADYHSGTLNLVSLTGETLLSFTGLEGPMDLAISPRGEMCVAEMLGGRVSCYDAETLRP